jgi:putative oxidoreductase
VNTVHPDTRVRNDLTSDTHRFPRPAAHITGWLLQALLALAIAVGGLLKLIGDPSMVALFDDVDAEQWLRPVVGTLAVAGAVGLLIPRLRALAAFGLMVLLAGAAITNTAALDTNPLIPLVYSAIAGVVLAIRKDELPLRASPEFPTDDHSRHNEGDTR